MGCLMAIAPPLLLESCTGTKFLRAEIKGSSLLIPLKEFEQVKKGDIKYLPYIIAENSRLEYPLAVFRLSSDDYSAVFMKCTHQGAELQVYGDRLQCPAHGSEFNRQGDVFNGPADQKLRSFPAKVEDNILNIDLS